MATVIPAYGKDYKTEEEAKAAWDEGKDFVTQSLDIGFNQYCSKRDFKGTVNVRFDKKQQVIVVKGAK